MKLGRIILIIVMIVSLVYTIHATVHNINELIVFIAGLMGRGVFANAVYNPLFGNSSLPQVIKDIKKPIHKRIGLLDV